jgi:hypothetical protein
VSVLPSDLAGEQTFKSTADIDGPSCNMDIRISPDAVVSSDRSFVIFDAHVGERSVQCSIAREALEQYFWAPVGASDAQLLKSYADGRRRIEAIVSRKLLAAPGEAVGLDMSDFAR